jgi:ribosomal protein L11 methyltransferase
MNRYPTVHVAVKSADVERAGAMLWQHGATGIEERDASTMDKSDADVTLVAHFASEDEANIVAVAMSEHFPAEVRFIEGDDWRERWKEFFKPARIGRRIVIRPSWESFDTKEGDLVITIDPGQAFGTGTHESTQLVLEELDATLRGNERVLDVGCGSGFDSLGGL